MSNENKEEKIKTLFISDVHLGNSNSQANKLLDVLKKYDFDNLFIVGDFIDMTYMKRKYFWKSDHSKVIQKILKLSRKNKKIVYIVGNHDYFIRSILVEGSIKFGEITICDEYIYQTEKGEKILILHGDCFDGFIITHPFIYWIGDKSYEISIKFNKIFNWFRSHFGLPYWSLSSFLKNKVKNVIKFLNEYRKVSKEMIKTRECDSIMIGHTHSPEIILGEYYNCGDFCESCSYIIEDLDGNIKLNWIK